MSVTYGGVDATGRVCSGTVSLDAEEVVRIASDAGWTDLEVYSDGVQVGGITDDHDGPSHALHAWWENAA